MVLKRILAYTIDYLIIFAYAGILFLVTYSIHTISGIPLEIQDPISGNLTSFLLLTLPVFLYFYFFESSKKQGTFGKQILKLKIENNTRKNVFIRVFMKILPWEIAHFGIHYSVYYNSQDIVIPIWNWTVNIIPQIVVLVYFISVVTSKGKSSIYDKLANTSISST